MPQPEEVEEEEVEEPEAEAADDADAADADAEEEEEPVELPPLPEHQNLLVAYKMLEGRLISEEEYLALKEIVRADGFVSVCLSVCLSASVLAVYVCSLCAPCLRLSSFKMHGSCIR